MNRQQRTIMAQETVAICDQGFYKAANGTRVSIESELAAARAGTKLYAPEMIRTPSPGQHRTIFSVRNETTFQGIQRLSASGNLSHVGCLNFASAKNPGGGFLNGAIAQEEALAAASGLYPSLLEVPQYYERNRAHRSALYLDLAIFSPRVPFLRDDSGTLLSKPIVASVITSPAPNAGAVEQNEPANTHKIKPALRHRAQLILSIAAMEKVDGLVLGAWGCGVFRNDPKVVAAIFAELLETNFAGVFKEVAFAVLDRSDSNVTYRAFEAAFTGLIKPNARISV